MKASFIAIRTLFFVTWVTVSASASHNVHLERDLKIVSGDWRFEQGVAVERSDSSAPEGQPLFATFAKQQPDHVAVTVEFELYDDGGQVVISPAWTDANNYVAAVWVNRNELRLVHVRHGTETVLARAQFDHMFQQTYRISATVSGAGIRASIDGKQVLEAGAYFLQSDTAAVGGRFRVVGFRSVAAKAVEPWSTDATKLCPIELLPAVGRRAFARKESGAGVDCELRNVSDQSLSHVRVVSHVDSLASGQDVHNLAPGASVNIRVPVPAERLRPDAYQLMIRAEADDRPPAGLSIPVQIARRPNPQRMRVFLWDSVPVQGIQRLADMGFTGTFLVPMSYEKLWAGNDDAPNSSDVAHVMARLDEAMMLGIDGAISFGPGHFTATNVPELKRVRRDGTPHEQLNTCNFLPQSLPFAVRGAEQFMKTYGAHPAFKMALLNTEMRDGAEPCFHLQDFDAYREATKREMPAEVASKYGVPHKLLAGFPSDRVVDDDHPLRTYYRWFWQHGDSWEMANDRIAQTIRDTGKRDDFITWFDPAVRVAPMYGAGAGVDMLGQWTYTYPDPVRIGMNADELLNMARPRNQMVFQMVQAFWYRSETAPKDPPREMTERNPWDDHDPDADYITASPAHLTLGIWTAISRPIDMIGYHGVSSLLPGNGGTYNHTHPDTAAAMERIHRDVITPLGPMLQKIGDRPADVGFLQSFTTSVFGGPATFGWISGDIGNLWMASQYAGLQSEIIFEETVSERGLNQYKVLILPSCEVLPRSVFDAILAFQKRGGIVIGDNSLVPGITPDLRIEFIPSGLPLESREAWMRETAMRIRAFLNGRYLPFAISGNPKVILHTRERDGVQYIFAINDEKEFGDYAGQHGRVKENGLPAETEITLQRTGVKVVNLLDSTEVPARADETSTRFTARLDPGGGAIYVVTEKLPAMLKVDSPSTAKRGETIAFKISVLDAAGDPIAASVPINVQIIDPALRPAEPSGSHAAVHGSAEIPFELADNERIGIWRATITERITGLKQTVFFRVH